MARVARQRLKLLNALTFFSTNVLHPGKVKLFKLLYFLDFIHFSQTGRSVTGLKYDAWEMGPVPTSLDDEWDDPRPDFNQHVTRMDRSYDTGKVSKALKVMREPNLDIFTDRELRLMDQLVKTHFRHTAKEMTDASHFKSGPWDIIYKKQNRKREEIPYELALLGVENKDKISESAIEYEELLSNYGQ